MAYKHYSPRCKTAYFRREELIKAVACYKEEEKNGSPCFLCESEVCAILGDFRTLDLGGSPEEMARRLYALLRKGEGEATLLIGVEPQEKGGVMAGVLNRMRRAFGAEHGTKES